MGSPTSQAGAASVSPNGLSGEKWADLLAGRTFRLNLADEFDALVDLRPDAPLCIVARHGKNGHSYETLSFRDCRRMAHQYARGMQQRGIQRDDTAIILAKPGLDFVPVFLGLWKLGAVPVAVDPGAPKQQKLKAIEEIAPKVLVGIPMAHALRLLYPRVFRSISRALTVGKRGVPGAPALESLGRDSKDAPFPSVTTSTADSMAIVFTTGSTGPPKGVVNTLGNGAAIIQIMKDALGIGPGDICLACHPAFALYFIGAAATVVTPDMDPRYPRAADPACLLAIIRDTKPVVAFMQIPVIRNLWQYCASRGEKIPHLRTILTTGASVPLELIEGVHQVLGEPGADLQIMYGATEALCISYASGREMIAAAPRMRDGKGTYLGRPSPWVNVKAIGITGQPIPQWSSDLELPPGQIGEICVSGPMVTPEYCGRPEATAKAKIQSATGLWHRMGDAGYLDDSGGLWYCGRIADRVATEQGDLYSDLVEPIFNQHPAVSRSALVGIPDACRRGKRPVLLVEPKAGGDPALAAELQLLAKRHPNTSGIEDVLIYSEAFPVDVRHGAKIRRDQLTRYAAAQLTGSADRLPADRTIPFQGSHVAYYEKGQGQPMLFLHNAGNDHHIWEHQLEYFSARYRVIGADSLGYGRSGTPKVAYSLPLYTEMVEALVDSLSLAPVTIVATCTGAAMALNYTLQHPEKVKRLILFHLATEKSVLGGNLERTTKMVSGRPLMGRVVGRITEVLMRRGKMHKAIIEGQYGSGFEEDPAFLDHLHRLYSRTGEGACLINLFSHWDSFAVLDNVQIPAGFPPLHIMWGERNEVIPLPRGEEMRQRLAPISFDVIPGGGHLVMREKAAAVNRRIAELLELPGAH